MLNYSVRPLTEADQPLLWEMLFHALYVPEGQDPFSRQIVNEPSIARYVLDWGRRGDRGFAAIDQATSNPCGAVWIRLFTEEDHGYGYVRDDIPELSIALLPEYRNQGIGTALLRHLIADVQGQCEALSLSVSLDNPAMRLYQRLGYEIVEQNGTALTMKKTLNLVRH